MSPSAARSFREVAERAFPRAHRIAANKAANALQPFVDEQYLSRSRKTFQVRINGESAEIPSRTAFNNFNNWALPWFGHARVASQCLLSRSTDGYLRQKAVRKILTVSEPWVVPFVVLLAGEYVVEIIEDIVSVIDQLDRRSYVNFVLENRPVIKILRARAQSYWNEYYRHASPLGPVYPEKRTYPGLFFLNSIEGWAS